MQPRSGGKAAARRLIRLRRPNENWKEFAERIGVSPQVVSNYKQEKYGLDLDILARVARKLTDADLLYVIAGRRKETVEEWQAAYRDGYRAAIDAARQALAQIETSGDAPLLEINQED